MKTKLVKLALAVTMAAGLSVGSSWAQSYKNYYFSGPYISIGSRGDLIVEEDRGYFRVRYETTIYPDSVQTYRNGSPLPGPSIDSPEIVISDDFLLPKLCNIFSTVMNYGDRNYAYNDLLLIMLYVNSDTGQVMEVSFRINPYKEGFIHIDPEKWLDIDIRIRQEISFELTPHGRNRNFVILQMPFRGRDIGMMYNFTTNRWYGAY